MRNVGIATFHRILFKLLCLPFLILVTIIAVLKWPFQKIIALRAKWKLKHAERIYQLSDRCVEESSKAFVAFSSITCHTNVYNINPEYLSFHLKDFSSALKTFKLEYYEFKLKYHKPDDWQSEEEKVWFKYFDEAQKKHEESEGYFRQKLSHIRTFQVAKNQMFILPKPLMTYLIKNPTSKAWTKLIKSCKFFIAQNRMLFIDGMEWKENNKLTIYNGSKRFDGNIIVETKKEKLRKLFWNFVYKSLKKPRPYLDPSTRFTDFFQFWLKNEFIGTPKLLNSCGIFQNIYRSDIRDLKLIKLSLKYSDYVILTESKALERVAIGHCYITHDQKRNEAPKLVQLPELLALVPTVQKFLFRQYSQIESESWSQFAKLSNFPNFKTFTLMYCDETMAIDVFVNFMRRVKGMYTLFLNPSMSQNEEDAFCDKFSEFLLPEDQILPEANVSYVRIIGSS